MLKTHAVGIDLGTTYSCIAYLNEHGEPVTLANQEGELSTPSVVLFDTDGEIVVGTEALRNAVVKPNRVVQNSKRFMGDEKKQWKIGNRSWTPPDIATLVLKKLLDAAQEQIGEIERAVITVPAQFSEIQRQMTVEAGLRAGLKHVDMINEPVAAALCYVLGTEGIWFTELAEQQRILVYDLGGGTFDLSLVSYQKNEVKVIASSGDLNLGGIDWNEALLKAIAKQFEREFGSDPRKDPESLQFLALEVENTKRSLTVRPRSALTCQHGGNRKSYQIEQPQFESLTKKLVERTCELTDKLVRENGKGRAHEKAVWADIDVILTVGGSSRMPMIRNSLKTLGGRTLNTSLSPDQSIAHGATYYAGMLLTNTDFAKSILNEEVSARLASLKQKSVNARGLGIRVRDEQDNRIPHYLVPANTPLPASVTQCFGTVIPNQKRVHLRIVESGTATDQQYVELGTCVIEDLPPNLPANSQIEVTISYDEQARVHVSAKDVASGKIATTEIVREGGVVKKEQAARSAGKSDKAAQDVTDWQSDEFKAARSTAASDTSLKPGAPKPLASPTRSVGAASPPQQATAPTPPTRRRRVSPVSEEIDLGDAFSLSDSEIVSELEDAGKPVLLCNECGSALDHRGRCEKCGPAKAASSPKKVRVRPVSPGGAQPKPVRKTPGPAVPINDDDIIELEFADNQKPKSSSKTGSPKADAPRIASRPRTAGSARPATSAKPGAPKVKAPPLPPALAKKKDNSSGVKPGGLAEEGEEEFWQLDD